MSETLSSIIPDPEALLALEPEELAGVLLEYFNSLPHSDQRGQLNAHAFSAEWGIKGYPPTYCDPISQAIMEAWVWLEREGLIAPRPGDQHGWAFITRRGQRIKNSTELSAFRKANLLPKTLLHPVLAAKVWSPFLRGEYDTAIFQAFKEVEVAVREAGKFTADDFGIALVRKAFDKLNGPLADPDLPDSEREAMAHLFAGAIGLYKNPHSHRQVSISEPAEAVELIIMASHLLRIIDARSGHH